MTSNTSLENTNKPPMRNDGWETNESTSLLGRPFLQGQTVSLQRVTTTRITPNRL